VNAYFPSGTSGDERQGYKYQWLDEFFVWIEALKKERPNIILAGDYNIAHCEMDIHDPKGNKKSSGFLPEERAWMDQFLGAGWIDSFRHKNPTATGAYSWWSQRFPSVRLNNKGWRIDYLCTTLALEKQIKDASILPLVKHSDHCPIVIELKK
jgi:exodeoxyribonuclease-3